MSHTVHSGKGKLAILFDVATELSIGGPRPPLISDHPVLGLDPLAGSPGSDCTIGIPRVVHEAVFRSIAQKNSIDPNRTFTENLVRIVHLVIAVLEFLYVRWDVESLPHICTVYIVRHRIKGVYGASLERSTFLVKPLLYL